MLIELLDKILEEWSPVLAAQGIHLCPPLQIVKIGDPAARSQKLTTLLFDSGEKQPVLVMKIAQGEKYRRFLTTEYQALTRLALKPDLSGKIPAPLAQFEHEGTLVVLEGVLPGVSLLEYLQIHSRKRPATVRRDLEQACDFLLRFQKSTRLEKALPPLDVRARLSALEAIYGPLELPSDYLDRLLEQEKAFNTCRIAQCARHGDYWPGNLLVGDHGVGVIDWEGYSADADPFFDLFFFFTTYVLSYPWHGWQACSPDEAFALGFLDDNWLAETIRENLLAYFSKLNITPTLTAFAYQIFLIKMCLPGAIEPDPRYPPQYEQWFSFCRRFAASPYNVLQ